MGLYALVMAEFAAIFVIVPLLIYKRVLPNLPIPLLLVVALGAFVQLRRNQAFDPARLWNAQAAWRHLPWVLLQDLTLIAIPGVLVWQLRPDLLFSLPKRSPALWAAIMMLYPILSVYPQELLFRAYFFERYAPLFGRGWGIIAASTGFWIRARHFRELDFRGSQLHRRLALCAYLHEVRIAAAHLHGTRSIR